MRMDPRPFDELAWPPRKASGASPTRHTTPPVAETLGLPSAKSESAIWHDDFLIVGSRLRAIWDEIEIDEEEGAYLVPYAPGYSVGVSCRVGGERAESVCSSCPIIRIPDGMAGRFEFALRESAELPLARLSFAGGWLVADHELPFVGAGVPALRASVEAVGWATQRLRPELTAACLSYAG